MTQCLKQIALCSLSLEDSYTGVMYVEISVPPNYCETKKRFKLLSFPYLNGSSSDPCRKMGPWVSKCSAWTEIILPYFL